MVQRASILWGILLVQGVLSQNAGRNSVQSLQQNALAPGYPGEYNAANTISRQPQSQAQPVDTAQPVRVPSETPPEVYPPNHEDGWQRAVPNNRRPIAVQQTKPRAPLPAPKPAGPIKDSPAGPLGPLGPTGPKSITWDDVIVAKPNPVSVKVLRPNQVIQLLVPVTIFVDDKWPIKAISPPRSPVRRNSNVPRGIRRPVRRVRASRRRRRIARRAPALQPLAGAPIAW